MLKSKIGRLRILSLIEGMSMLVLLFIAMPLKYFFHMPFFVKVVGSIHGGLFLLFVFMILAAAVEFKWKFTTTAVLLISSIVPFGCFYADKKIFRPMETPVKA